MWAFAGALLSFFGFIHRETLGWAQQPLVAPGYALFGAVCLILGGRRAVAA
jgi:AGZA family xanthine/uracil permease-like MFS transporter